MKNLLGLILIATVGCHGNDTVYPTDFGFGEFGTIPYYVEAPLGD